MKMNSKIRKFPLKLVSAASQIYPISPLIAVNTITCDYSVIYLSVQMEYCDFVQSYAM